MTHNYNNSFIPFQPITVLQGFNSNSSNSYSSNSNSNSNKQVPDPLSHQRRTPSPADTTTTATTTTISESFSTIASTSNNAIMNMMMTMTTTTTHAAAADDDSPVPSGLDASSQSSPGSASDHMGMIPNTVTSHMNGSSSSSHGVQPLFPGSSVLAAFDAGNPNLAYGHHHHHPPLNHHHPQPQVTPSIPLSSTTFASGVTVKSPVASRRKGGSGVSGGKAAAGKTNSTSTTSSHSNGNNNGGTQPGNPNRRQSRLQRNRESARLSRKRRKQYLELLEERVDQLSETLDGSRRAHVSKAVATLNQKRIETILQYNNHESQKLGVTKATPDENDTMMMKLFENNLSRTNEELMIANTFQYQQLKSFSIPPSMQFTLWLTLQTDTYFRGGRTASERLSAARIGERVRW